MSTKDEVRDFLVSRRANVTPQQAGIPSFGERRVPGLRREEVALLAGVSLDYYTRLERGNIRGASESVLEAIARALRLNDAEREYLFDLARTAPAGVAARTRRPAPQAVRTSVQRVLDHMTVPAVVHNATQDIVAANLMGRALYAPHFDTEGTPNMARFIFLDGRAQDYYVDWPLARRTAAAMMRLEAGRDPLNADLTALVGELSTRSPQFRADWAGHDVHEHRTGVKSFRHPEVGVIEVAFDVFEMPGEAGLQIVTYSAPPGTDSADRFALLASWAATREAAEDGAAGADGVGPDAARPAVSRAAGGSA
ncbi:helix-turn-helix domain-containing protein [Promicromonospora kroppenstedtii]|uniref:Helix-turn-helix domain-containing protein n=1 Tax=Promicromonospora kroppenstedtii TaxID=440482 RepID=A0ABW7XDD5_9MICO